MAKYSLKKTAIIKRNPDFTRVIKNGNSIESEYFKMYVLPASEKRAGFTASRMIKTAVQRNKIKRRLREVYRLNMDVITNIYDIVLIGKKTILSADHKQIEQEFKFWAQMKRL